MTVRKFLHGFAAACALIAPGVAYGQAEDAFCDTGCYHEYQWFAPVDFDFDCSPIQRECGYDFTYTRLFWAATGERIGLGVPGFSNASMNGFRRFDDGGELIVIPDPDDPDGDPIEVFLEGVVVDIPPPFLPRGLNDVAPDADFAFGNRYEFGYFNGDAGWRIGIMEGLENNNRQFFGFGLSGQDDTVGGQFPSRIPGGPGQLASPLGSVLITFDDPLNLMLGYLDVRDGLVTEGPPGDQLEDDDNGDGVLDGDGIADDIDRDGQFGPDGLDFETPGEVPDALGGGLDHDLGDLVFLPTSWQFVDVRNTTKTNGVEIMKYHRLDNGYMMKKFQNNSMTVSAGVRYLQLKDEFVVSAEGGVLGLSFWDTRISNNLVGPQLGFNWHHQQKRFGLDINGRALLAYNISNFDQTVGLGEDLIVGQHNHPLYFPPTYANHGKQENEFSPTVEFRAEGSYQITQALAVKLGYSAIYIDNISRASAQVKYELPNMGFIHEAAGDQEILLNGADFGFELVY